MKEFLTRVLNGFEYQGAAEWSLSLAPTHKYSLFSVGAGLSAGATLINILFGLDSLAFFGLFVIMIAELTSGAFASHLKKENFSSIKLSRFTFKCAIYLILIAVPFWFYQSFHGRGRNWVAEPFYWIHIFFTFQIMVENLVSILENVGVIQGKDKAHWIAKIQDKADKLFL